MYGLTDEHIETIKSVIKKHTEVENLIIFGSRAMGNYKKASDVDLAIEGKNVSRDTVLKISFELNEETYIPYHFDVLHYDRSVDSPINQHIHDEGRVFL